MIQENISIKNLKEVLRKSKVSFLIGAGASFKILEGQKSYPLMRDLVNEIVENTEHKRILALFDELSLVRNCYNTFIVQKKNFEDYLSSLEGLVNYPIEKECKKNIEKLIETSKEIVINRIIDSNDETVLPLYEDFYKTLILFNQEKEEVFKRINVFTTNYDMLTEIALENIGIHYYAGFFGIKKRKYNPAFYNFTYTDDMNLKTKNYIVKNEHINLYKLHGSLSWQLSGDELIEIQDYTKNSNPVIIYPSHTKYNHTNLVAYYSSLMREFLNQIASEQTTLVVIGYSFGDEHLNKLIISALSIESFTLVAFLYSEDDYKQFSQKIGDRANIRILRGQQAKLEYFVESLRNPI